MAVPEPDPKRRLVLRTLLGLTCALAAWTALLVAAGGFDTTIAGVRIRSNNPSRVATAAAVAAVIFFLFGGRLRVPVRPLAAAIARAFRGIARHPGWVAAVIAAATMAAGIAYGARTAGGSDAYGYVSQAELWMVGRLEVPQPWAAEVPWTEKVRSFAPLGYRPAPGPDAWAIVPIYSPGVPMFLALAKSLVGQWGVYLVIPLFGALAVGATYRLGRHVGSPWLAVGGAWLIATTPPALAVLMEPLTDVPAMAMWTLVVVALLARGRLMLVIAGLLASCAILIRPNLVILVGPLALWPIVRRHDAIRVSWRSRLADAALFSIAAAPGAIFIAWLAASLYGSPFESGYGPSSYLYSWSRVLPNLPRYFGWYLEAHTPLALLGIAAMVVPLRRVWPDAPDRRIFPVMALFHAALWTLYASYFEYDSWGFLRFLLPGWPVLMLGIVASIVAIARLVAGRTTVATAIAVIAVVALGAWQLDFTRRQGLFNQRQAARHEIEIGRLVARHTDPNSVVITIQRSGSLRYYGGRVTLRYDYLDPPTLDRDVAWLAARGVATYALFDTNEVEEFRRRFAGQAAARLDTPLLVYTPGALFLYNLTPGAPAAEPITIDTIPPDRFDAVPPQPEPGITFKE